MYNWASTAPYPWHNDHARQDFLGYLYRSALPVFYTFLRIALLVQCPDIHNVLKLGQRHYTTYTMSVKGFLMINEWHSLRYIVKLIFDGRQMTSTVSARPSVGNDNTTLNEQLRYMRERNTYKPRLRYCKG